MEFHKVIQWCDGSYGVKLLMNNSSTTFIRRIKYCVSHQPHSISTVSNLTSLWKKKQTKLKTSRLKLFLLIFLSPCSFHSIQDFFLHFLHILKTIIKIIPKTFFSFFLILSKNVLFVFSGIIFVRFNSIVMCSRCVFLLFTSSAS